MRNNPVFIEIGINPEDLAQFGVSVVAGRAYAPAVAHEVMLGGGRPLISGREGGDPLQCAPGPPPNTVMPIDSTGNSFGDAGAMFPLLVIQGYNRLPGIVVPCIRQGDARHPASGSRHGLTMRNLN